MVAYKIPCGRAFAQHVRGQGRNGTFSRSRGKPGCGDLPRSRRRGNARMSSGGESGKIGGLARHIPVLANQVIDFLKVRDAGVYIRAILGAASAQVIGIDRDPSAVARGFDLVEAAGGRLVLVEDNFSSLDTVAESRGVTAVDGVVLDLGVSSMQLDEAERGFSFRFDGPLDMRMGRSGPSAADVVALASERDLADIIFRLGEERHSRAVARAIVAQRKENPIRTTRALADIVGSVVRARSAGIHPATRTFQALRIFINDELTELAKALV